MRIKTERLYYALGLLIGFIILVIWQLPPSHARMIACDVGQGDAILLTKGSNQVIVDGGSSGEKLLGCLHRYVPFWDRNIELIVLTNTDFDHMNGLSAVLERYSNNAFVTSDAVHDSDALAKLSSVITREHVMVQGAKRGEIIKVGKKEVINLQVLWPQKVNEDYLAVFSNNLDPQKREQILGASAKRGDLNEDSVVLLWDENGYKVLLTGDSGDQTEKELLKLGNLPDVDVIKIGHHGSKHGSTLEFLQAVKPETAVISVGQGNKYGHPTEETLRRLEQVGAKVRRTDREGDVVITLP